MFATYVQMRIRLFMRKYDGKTRFVTTDCGHLFILLPGGGIVKINKYGHKTYI